MITFNTAPERIRIWICFCLLNNPTGWYVSPVQTAGRQTSKGEGERMLPQLWALSLQRTWSLEHHSYLQSLYQGEKPQAATRLNGSLASKSGTKAKGPRWLLHNKIPSNTRRQSPQRPTSESSDSSGPLEYVPVNPPRETFTPAGSSHGPAGVSLKQKGWVLAVKKYNLGSLTCTSLRLPPPYSNLGETARALPATLQTGRGCLSCRSTWVQKTAHAPHQG